VRVKVDENLPAMVAALLRERGFEADTVIEEGLAGSTDEDLLAAMREQDRMIVTLDRGFGDTRRYPPGSHPRIVVLRLADESALATRAAVMQLLDNHDLETLSGTRLPLRPTTPCRGVPSRAPRRVWAGPARRYSRRDSRLDAPQRVYLGVPDRPDRRAESVVPRWAGDVARASGRTR
jgi:predicted nuclease of predicted toxin-antitoxin system